MRVLAAVFFAAMPLFIILTIVMIISPSSSSLGKVDGIVGILAIGSLLLMAGLRMYQRSAAEAPHQHRPGGFSG